MTFASAQLPSSCLVTSAFRPLFAAAISFPPSSKNAGRETPIGPCACLSPYPPVPTLGCHIQPTTLLSAHQAGLFGFLIVSPHQEFTRLLSPSAGHGVGVGVGLVFTVCVGQSPCHRLPSSSLIPSAVGLTWIQVKYTDLDANTAGEFTTAAQNVKPGLICCGIVSSWTGSATLLVSSTYMSRHRRRGSYSAKVEKHQHCEARLYQSLAPLAPLLRSLSRLRIHPKRPPRDEKDVPDLALVFLVAEALAELEVQAFDDLGERQPSFELCESLSTFLSSTRFRSSESGSPFRRRGEALARRGSRPRGCERKARQRTARAGGGLGASARGGRLRAQARSRPHLGVSCRAATKARSGLPDDEEEEGSQLRRWCRRG